MNSILGRMKNNTNGQLNVEAFLETFPSFRDFKARELREFARIVHVRWFKKDETIFYEKEPGIGMYFVHKGMVKITTSYSANGNEHPNLLSKGDFFGEMCLMDERPRSITAIATDDCCVIGIFRPDLMQLLNRKPRLGNKILLKLNKIISEQLQEKREEILQMKEKLSNSNFIL